MKSIIKFSAMFPIFFLSCRKNDTIKLPTLSYTQTISHYEKFCENPKASLKTKWVFFKINGINRGIQIMDIPKNSLFSNLGFVSMDIIRKINGTPISKLNEHSFSLFFAKYCNSIPFTILLERGGYLIGMYIIIKEEKENITIEIIREKKFHK
jgi:hypothetical protein